MNITKLYIKGLKEPIELSEKEGRYIQGIINDPTKPDASIVELTNGIWTGKKGDLRYVFFEKGERQETSDRKYTDSEMYKLKEELSSYFMKKGDSDYIKLVGFITKDILSDKEPNWSPELSNAIIECRDKNQSLENAEILAQKIVETFFVGKQLWPEGERQFLIDKQAIKDSPDNNYTVLVNGQNIPYRELSKKLSYFKWWVDKRELAYKERDKQLDELASKMEMNNNDISVDEIPF